MITTSTLSRAGILTGLFASLLMASTAAFAVDTDGDGIDDDVETALGMFPNRTDSDSDTIPDSIEIGSVSQPFDTDGDGVIDALDDDSDNDGISDREEGSGDVDGDGILNFRDLDSDGDGVSDTAEGTGDADLDGVPDFLDRSSDEDGDGIPDVFEGTEESDDDPLVDALDTDSDGDGIPDSVEAGLSAEQLATDSDGDGLIDVFDADNSNVLDADGDGVIDAYNFPDADGDGIPDYREKDSDNDGIPDRIEFGFADLDSDGDGLDDAIDVDVTGGTDLDGDGVDDAASGLDSDGDGLPDYRDLDSDNDGIADLIEVFQSFEALADANKNGIQDLFDAGVSMGLIRVDANDDDIDDTNRLPDTDGDGLPDFRDLDSDNDGVFDVVEGGSQDVNQDAVIDSEVVLVTAPPDSDNAVDFDSTGALVGPDYRDVDSNGDGVYDIAGTPFASFDANGDGRIDLTVDADRDGIDDSVDRGLGEFGHGGDADGDGLFNDEDADDDNDGLPDIFEGNVDTDGDGIVDRLDRDSDNDGLEDSREANLLPPLNADINSNGLDDAYDIEVNGSSDTDDNGLDDNIPLVDTDGDGVEDRLDTDSDGDTITDLIEQSGLVLFGRDVDRDGIDDATDVDQTRGVDENMNGIDDRYDRVIDTDGDGLENYRDRDSDNDGLEDGQENVDFNQDGIPDRLQVTPKIQTAVGGTGSIGALPLLSMFGFGLLVFALGAGRAQAAQPGCFNEQGDGSEEPMFQLSAACTYLGASMGMSTLEPETKGTGFRLIEDGDLAWKVFGGVQFHRNFFAEVLYSVLGDAEVRSINPNAGSAAISYAAPAVMAGFLLNGNRKSWDLFAKVGVSTLMTDSDSSRIAVEEDSSLQLAWAGGLLYHITPGLSVRGEFEQFSEDASSMTLGISQALKF
ncbi:hypothetical protein [Allohahella marinimesophila]|uniref:Outer membrane protein OmpA-like transmembrane domain-containing protein n=1 Tax=Allohahella marinimesophila TaxID=1054972 RepID=A0ABP7NKE7_9GAMM